MKENRIVWGSIQGVMTADSGDYEYTEDPHRPGFVEQKSLSAITYKPTEDYRQDMGNRIELVSHDRTNRHPSFMGQYMSKVAKEDKKLPPHSLPTNLEAAAELYALSLLHGFSDFNRQYVGESITVPSTVTGGFTDTAKIRFVSGGTALNTWAHLDDVFITAVPEPSAVALLGLAGFALLLRRRR